MRVAYYKIRNWFKGIVIRFRYESYALHLVRTRKYWEFYEYLSFSEKRSSEDVRKLMPQSENSYRQWQVLVALRTLEVLKLAKSEQEQRDIKQEGELYHGLIAVLEKASSFVQSITETPSTQSFFNDDHKDLCQHLSKFAEEFAKVQILELVPVFTKLPRGRSNKPSWRKLRRVANVSYA